MAYYGYLGTRAGHWVFHTRACSYLTKAPQVWKMLLV